MLVQVQDESGEPVTPPRPPVVEVRSGDLDLGEVALTETGVGTYRAEVVLPRPGRWEVQVALRLSRFESPVSTVGFQVRPGSDARGQAPAPRRRSTVAATGTVCTKPSTRTWTKSR